MKVRSSVAGGKGVAWAVLCDVQGLIQDILVLYPSSTSNNGLLALEIMALVLFQKLKEGIYKCLDYESLEIMPT
jgi:hypothetical protein